MLYIRAKSLKRLFSLKRRGFAEATNPNGGSDGEENSEESSEFCSRKPGWRCFSFQEVSDATSGFSSAKEVGGRHLISRGSNNGLPNGSPVENLVGRGGYAEVYRGRLSDGEEIAVKRLTRVSTDERRGNEFLTEIGTIGHVCHPNVLSLLGCCIDNGLYLIFKFSSRGSVASLLHDETLPPLEWKARYKIAVGTARGLHYLHKDCRRRIIHRDIKSSNVLLTLDFEPLISDFGLAKWLPSQWSHHSIAPIEGTFGHLAPEYYMHGIVDEKTDVFAFGVFLLEIISGRRPVDKSHQSLHSWAKPILNKGEIEKLVDPRLNGVYECTELERLGLAASLCIRAASMWRPTMNEVLKVMEEEEVDKERWKMGEEEEEDEDGEFCGFEDLEYESDLSFSTTPPPHHSLAIA